MLKIIIVWILTVFFAQHSLFTTIRGNFNAGVLLMWIITAILLVYALFHRHIDVFCQAGVGRVLKIIFWAGAALFCGLFVFVAVSGYTDKAKGDEKALIVLGAGLHGDRISDVLYRRLAATLEAHKENPNAVIVVTGGQGPQENMPEAVAMRNWLIAQDVPEECILLEDKSTSTQENLTFAKAILEEHGISADEPVAVVTNAFHCYRAGKYAEKLGFSDVQTVPASISITSVLPTYMREILAVLFMWVFRRQLA